mgnify:CR=1 FL=1
MNGLVVKLELTVEHINTILKHLGAGAYAEVADIIGLLHGQATNQIQAAATPADQNQPQQDEVKSE